MNPHRPDRDLLSRLLSADPDDVDLFDAMGDAGAELLDQLVDSLPPVTPSTGAAQRLLAAVAPSPWRRFAQDVSALFEVAIDAAVDTLDALTDPAKWEDLVAGAISLQHVSGGPALASADVGYVRVAEGTAFPPHTHTSEERTLVLGGGMRLEDGRVLRAGDTLVLGAGTPHRFTAVEGELLFAVVSFGVEFEDASLTDAVAEGKS